MLSFTHCVAHGGDKVAEFNQHSEQMLDELQKEYPDVFSELTYPIWEHRQLFQILLIDTSKQFVCRHLYPLSSEELTALKKQINEWLDSGRIVPSASPYCHPVLFAEKKGRGGLCLCVDYCSLNVNMVTDAWPLLRIDDLLSRLKGAKISTSLELRDGYHQIPIDIVDRYKTAFTCRYGQHEYIVMSFGFKNAPDHF